MICFLWRCEGAAKARVDCCCFKKYSPNSSSAFQLRICFWSIFNLNKQQVFKYFFLFGHFSRFYAIKIIKHDRNIEDESIDSTEWTCQKKISYGRNRRQDCEKNNIFPSSNPNLHVSVYRVKVEWKCDKINHNSFSLIFIVFWLTWQFAIKIFFLLNI